MEITSYADILRLKIGQVYGKRENRRREYGEKGEENAEAEQDDLDN